MQEFVKQPTTENNRSCYIFLEQEQQVMVVVVVVTSHHFILVSANCNNTHPRTNPARLIRYKATLLQAPQSIPF